MKTIKIGTRGSKLAVRQTEIIIDMLKKHHPDVQFEMVEIKTTGDKFLDVTLSKIGGKGLFIKEIEEAMLRDEIDMAVHSLKDMPAEVHEALTLAAFSKREDPSDCLISRLGLGLDRLPFGAKVGTSSLRRVCQLKNKRPDLEVQPLRGNIITRIGKLEEGHFDAIILASAGIMRLNMGDKITEKLPTDTFVPAVCQGIICVETKKDRHDIIDMLKVCDDPASRTAAACERAFLKRLNGNCKIPIGAYCEIQEDRITVSGMLGREEDLVLYRDRISDSIQEAEKLGVELAERIIAQIGHCDCENKSV